jgi:methyl-accepting chemotaxis protein
VSLQAATSAVQGKMERIHERSAALAPLSTRFDKQLNDQMAMMHRIESDLTQIVDAGHSTDRVVSRGRVAAAGALEQARAVEQSLKTARYELRLTEKRIKTVAERSQEIGVLVRTIGDLAERTGILALNASLQAAATDSAGRQFAPIAQEVKRLADSAGQAVVQAERLVNAIREETGFAAQASATATSSVTALGKRISEHSVVADELTAGIDALAEQLSGIDSLASRYRQDLPQAKEGHEKLLEVQTTLGNLLGEQVGAVAKLRDDVQQILRLASVMPVRTVPDTQSGSPDRPTDADASSNASGKTKDGHAE